jgi:hypothetical protein
MDNQEVIKNGQEVIKNGQEVIKNGQSRGNQKWTIKR